MTDLTDGDQLDDIPFEVVGPLAASFRVLDRGRAEDFVDEWIVLRAEGASYREIGEAYGFSHERVRQLVGHLTPVASSADIRRRIRARQLADWLGQHGPVTYAELKAKLGVDQRQLNYLAQHTDGIVPMHLVVLDGRPTTLAYETTEMIDALQDAWSRVPDAKRAKGLSHVRYAELRTPGQPAAPTVINRFGTWDRACWAAGVPTGGHYRPKHTYRRRWSNDDLLGIIADYVDDAALRSERPTYLGYERYQAGHADRPSGTTVRLQLKAAGLGTWPEILERARRGSGEPETSGAPSA